MLWIVGGESAIGTALQRVCRAEQIDFLASSRRVVDAGPGRFLDLAADPGTWNLPPGQGCAILCASIANLALCESDPAGTGFINVTQTLELGRRLRERGWRVVFLSSNLVFDGAMPFVPEDQPCSPRTEYGRQKVDVERGLLAGGGALTVRFTKVILPGFGLFRGWRDRLGRGLGIEPFHDFNFAPLPLDFVAEQLIRMARSPLSGVVHLGGERDISYAEAAFLLAGHFGFSREAVRPISRRERSDLSLPYGLHTTLGSRRDDLEPVRVPTVEETLRECFERML